MVQVGAVLLRQFKVTTVPDASLTAFQRACMAFQKRLDPAHLLVKLDSL
jgi:hypothetical protein